MVAAVTKASEASASKRMEKMPSDTMACLGGLRECLRASAEQAWTRDLPITT